MVATAREPTPSRRRRDTPRAVEYKRRAEQTGTIHAPWLTEASLRRMRADPDDPSRKVTCSIMFEWLRRGGGRDIRAEGDEGPLADAARAASSMAALGKSHKTKSSREQVWRSFEAFVMYMIKDDHPYKVELKALDRVLFNPAPGDPEPADFVFQRQAPLAILVLFMRVLIGSASDHFKSEAAPPFRGKVVKGRSMRGIDNVKAAIGTLERAISRARTSMIPP